MARLAEVGQTRPRVCAAGVQGSEGNSWPRPCGVRGPQRNVRGPQRNAYPWALKAGQCRDAPGAPGSEVQCIASRVAWAQTSRDAHAKKGTPRRQGIATSSLMVEMDRLPGARRVRPPPSPRAIGWLSLRGGGSYVCRARPSGRETTIPRLAGVGQTCKRVCRSQRKTPHLPLQCLYEAAAAPSNVIAAPVQV